MGDNRSSLMSASRRAPASAYAPRPSAYAHYKALVTTLDELDEQVSAEQRRLEDLEADLRRHEHAVHKYERQRQAQALAAWERERDRQLDTVCQHRVTLEQVRREREGLEAQELRLTAELEVVREQQQRELETDAKRIRDLVHTQSLVLERELTKGQVDFEMLQQIVQSARQRKQQKPDLDEGEKREAEAIGIGAVVSVVQQRREEAFRAAAAQFQQRLQSFEREKEALRQQTEELQRRKQRALQILSSNQQQVVQGFFTTPRTALESVNPPMPSLSFEAIMATLQQSGNEVNRLQGVSFAQLSARQRLDDALQTAQANLVTGPERLHALEQRMRQRERDVEALRVQSRESRDAGAIGYGPRYDGRWRLDTYPPEELAVASSMRKQRRSQDPYLHETSLLLRICATDSSTAPEPSTSIESQTKKRRGWFSATPKGDDQELGFWTQHVVPDILSFSSLPSCGLVSSVQLSSDARLLACGTLDGEIVVFDLAAATATASVSPLAVRVWVPTAGSAAKKTPVLGARARIQRLAFSSDGRLLLASNQLKSVALWSLHPLVSPSSHSSDCFTSDISKHKPDSLELVDELSPAEVFRELPCPPTVLTRDTPSFHAKAQSRPPISITSTEFVPTLSLFPANRPSVLCAASNGDLMRVWPQGNVVKEKNDLSAASAAAFDVPAPGDTALGALTRPAAREMWRVHQVAVLFVGLLRCAASLESPSLRFVTVDQDGFVARWRHDGAQFSGFGWFTPTDICRLDLSVSPTDSAKGEMLQIALSPTRNRLIVMVYFGSSSAPSAPRGRLRFVQLDVHSDDEMTVVPVRRH
ncbi:hypothetical protein P43SY_002195 [Pythium insidiosum]|uniref:Uncharacterized protein n=1 Tax=Pythium insidiosum TaxID=114742 RepID=A0AAD5QCL8_PYTIN|nr:hypothetical protein P43SY_002195 [Pythium insidiosum]